MIERPFGELPDVALHARAAVLVLVALGGCASEESRPTPLWEPRYRREVPGVSVVTHRDSAQADAVVRQWDSLLARVRGTPLSSIAECGSSVNDDDDIDDLCTAVGLSVEELAHLYERKKDAVAEAFLASPAAREWAR